MKHNFLERRCDQELVELRDLNVEFSALENNSGLPRFHVGFLSGQGRQREVRWGGNRKERPRWPYVAADLSFFLDYLADRVHVRVGLTAVLRRIVNDLHDTRLTNEAVEAERLVGIVQAERFAQPSQLDVPTL